MSKSKRELREQRRAAERAAAAAESRRRRIRNLAVAAGAAVVLVVAGIAISSAGGSPKTEATVTSSVVAGIQEHDGVLGDPKAPITVTEYLDPQCPICAEASKANLPNLINNYVRTGKVKLQARTLSFIGPDSVRAAKVAAGAAQQNKLWSFLETFYANQGTENSGYVTDGFLTSVAKSAGVNADKALAFADGNSAQQALDQADAQAQALKVDSTPSFTVTKPGGKETVVAVGLGDLTGKLDAALKG